MKTSRKHLLHIIALFVFLWTFQSCQVYYKTTVSVAEAVKAPEEQWIKAKMKNGQIHNFGGIFEQNSHLFGRTTKKGDYVLFATMETLESLQLQNKQLSNVGNAFIVVGFLGLISWVLWVTVVQPALDIDLGTFSYP